MMKKVSTIVGWLTYIATVASLLIFYINGNVFAIDYAQTVTRAVPNFGTFLLNFFILVYLVIGGLIMFWRPKKLDEGNKVLPGVLSLIFVNPIVGVLTLLIPQSELGNQQAE